MKRHSFWRSLIFINLIICSIVPSSIIKATEILFYPIIEYNTGDGPLSVIGTDFNHDGYPDIVIANGLANTLLFLQNKNDGAFFKKPDCITGGFPWALTAGDFDNDGCSDLAVAKYNSFSIHMNNKYGDFSNAREYHLGGTPTILTAADFNSDGYSDLALGDEFNDTLSVLINNNNQEIFDEKHDYPTGMFPSSIVNDDFNKDCCPDLVVTNSGNNTVSLYINKGDGTFFQKVDYETGIEPSCVTTDDYNNDGYSDLAVSNLKSNTVSVLINFNGESFNQKVDYATNEWPRAIASDDFNGDGYPDLAVVNEANNTISIFINNGNGIFTERIDHPTGLSPISVTSKDFNQDGYFDIAVANSESNSVSVFINKGENIKKVLLVRSGEIYNTISAALSYAMTGDTLKITSGFYQDTNFIIDKDIYLEGGWDPNFMIKDPQHSPSVLAGRQGIPVISFIDSHHSIIDGFTITTCMWTSNSTAQVSTVGNLNETYGGGIYCRNSSPTVKNCLISHNSAAYGGGTYCENSHPTIIHCTINNNNAINKGGGIYCTDCLSPTIINCAFSHNTNSGGLNHICIDEVNFSYADMQLILKEDIKYLTFSQYEDITGKISSRYKFFQRPCGKNIKIKEKDILFVTLQPAP